jgi:hypothetical protein
MNRLLWKHWRESKAYLAIFIAWMVLAACYVIGYEVGHEWHCRLCCLTLRRMDRVGQQLRAGFIPRFGE